MNYVNHVSCDDMKKEIIERYGPTIHNVFVDDMPCGRIARIYIEMKKLGPSDPNRLIVPIKVRKKPACIPGQLSLFD